MSLDELTFEIRGCLFEVFRELGPGLFESVYEHALMYELQLRDLNVKSQMGLPVAYKDTHLHLGFRVDLVVEELVLLEIKSVEALHDVHKKQLLTYLKLSEKKIGFLVNFNVVKLEDKVSLIRIIN